MFFIKCLFCRFQGVSVIFFQLIIFIQIFGLERFVGGTYTALVEEPIQGEDLAIARIYSQAPDVDGLTVIMGEGLKEGDVVRVGIRAVRGLDLEAVLINE